MAKNIKELKMGLRDRIFVNRGEVTVSSSDILETHISTCVSVCLYHSEYKLGGITHISRSHEVDNTPSGKYIKTSGYYYADSAIPRLLYLFKKRNPLIRAKSLEGIVVGGLNNEGPVLETLSELNNYEFRAIGYDVNKIVYRHVVFDTALGIVTVGRKQPFAEVKSTKRFKF